jgi:hypothetical protein
MSSDVIPFSPSTTRPKESQKLEILGGLKKLQDRVGERKLEEFRAVFAAGILKSTRASNLPTGIDAGPSFP